MSTLLVMLILPLHVLLSKANKYLTTRSVKAQLSWMRYFLNLQSRQSSMSVKLMHIAINLDSLQSFYDILDRGFRSNVIMTPEMLRDLLECKTMCIGQLDYWLALEDTRESLIYSDINLRLANLIYLGNMDKWSLNKNASKYLNSTM